MNDRRFPPGLVPAAAATIATLSALAFLVGAVLFGLTRCAPRPAPQASPPTAQASAVVTSSAALTASQGVKVTIRRPSATLDPGVQDRSPDAPQEPRSIGGRQVEDEEIVIELSSAVSAVAASEATSSALAPVAALGDAFPTHGRLGVALTTMPGALVGSYQLARVDVPPWMMGAPLEVGLDLLGNLEAGGAGVSVGGKAFAIAGAWSRWDGREQGLALGAGMRF